jgi:hypothetical protein
VDEQFTHFVDMIQQVHINVPLIEAMRVPTYARYLKDILTKKRYLPTSEVVKLTKELLTANFRQPSHEFTFGVGMNFISYPLLLTP